MVSSISLKSYERTNRVKKSKFNLLVYSYKLFKMKQSKSTRNIYTCFTYKGYSNLKLVSKMLRSLPKI